MKLINIKFVNIIYTNELIHSIFFLFNLIISIISIYSTIQLFILSSYFYPVIYSIQLFILINYLFYLKWPILSSNININQNQL